MHWLVTPPRIGRLGRTSPSRRPGLAADNTWMPKLMIVALAGAGVLALGGPGGLGPAVTGVGAALIIEATFGALVLAAQRRGGLWQTFAVRRAMAMTVLGLALMGAALAAGAGVRPGPASGASPKVTGAVNAGPVPTQP